MSLKEKVEAMRVVIGKRPCKHGYNMQEVVGTLYAYISQLESAASQPDTIKVKVGMMKAEVSAGDDGKFGTKDDTVKLSVAKRKPLLRNVPR